MMTLRLLRKWQESPRNASNFMKKSFGCAPCARRQKPTPQRTKNRRGGEDLNKEGKKTSPVSPLASDTLIRIALGVFLLAHKFTRLLCALCPVRFTFHLCLKL